MPAGDWSGDLGFTANPWKLPDLIPGDLRPTDEQIADAIRRVIADGVYPVGRSIPGQGVAARRYGVSPATINRAFRRLKDEGVLRGEGNRGHFVVRVPRIGPA